MMVILTCAFLMGIFCQTRSQGIWLNSKNGADFNYHQLRPDMTSEPSHLHPVFLQAPSQNEFQKVAFNIDEGERPKLQLNIHLPKHFHSLNNFQPVTDSTRNQDPSVIYGFIPILSDNNEDERRINTNSELGRNKNTPNTFHTFSQNFDSKQQSARDRNHHHFNDREQFNEHALKQRGGNRTPNSLLHAPTQNSYTVSDSRPNLHPNNRFLLDSQPNNHLSKNNFNVNHQANQDNARSTYKDYRDHRSEDYNHGKLVGNKHHDPSTHFDKIVENESNDFEHDNSRNVPIPEGNSPTTEPVIIPVNDISPINVEVTEHPVLHLNRNSDKETVFIPTLPVIPNDEREKKLFLVFKAPVMVTTERPASAPFSIKQKSNLNGDKITDEKTISSLQNGNKFENRENKLSWNQQRDYSHSLHNNEGTDTQLSFQHADPKHGTLSHNNDDLRHSSKKDSKVPIHHTIINNHNNRPSIYSPSQSNTQLTHFLGGSVEKVSKYEKNTVSPTQKYPYTNRLPHRPLPKETQSSTHSQSAAFVNGNHPLSGPHSSADNTRNSPHSQAIPNFHGNNLPSPSSSPSIAQFSYIQSSLPKNAPKNNLTSPVPHSSFSVSHSKAKQPEIKNKKLPSKTYKESKFSGKSEISLHDSDEDGANIPGRPGADYPNYNTIPFTNFECGNMKGPGFYADLESRCQVFHNCDVSMAKHSFMCPNGTIFHQELVICDWWYNVRCEDSPQFYNLFNHAVENSSIL